MGDEVNDRITKQTCPYLGCYWDRVMRSMVPDRDNRCFACEERYRVWWFVRRTKTGARIELPRQEAVCYGEFHRCEQFQIKEGPEEIRQG